MIETGNFRIVRGSTQRLNDAEEFIAQLSDLQRRCGVVFDAARPVYVARAPGRLDLMGGIADYSGSLVLQMPIAEAALAALQRDPAPVITIVSLDEEGTDAHRHFSMPLADFYNDGQPVSYETARDYFRHDPLQQWAAYVAGALLVLMREREAGFDEGARILITSRVPEGKGVSSSAALEVASMQAIAAAFDIELAPRELALLCQKVENLVVGAPCGVMDQMTAACGEAGRLLELLCQPAQLLGTAPIPGDLAVWGIDSGVEHSVSGADYSSVRVGAFMGYRMICELAGLRARPKAGLVEVDDTRWRGYLANLTPSEFEQFFAHHLPERISGAEFLARFQGITDPVTSVDPQREYAVKAPTAHPVYEHFRVRAFAELLSDDPSERQRELLGELMYQSHASYSACGLGSEGTDLLVNLTRKIGPGGGLYGAKITGGGSGGTVAILGHAGAEQSVKQVVMEYEEQTGYKPQVFHNSSLGAAAFGWVELWQ